MASPASMQTKTVSFVTEQVLPKTEHDLENHPAYYRTTTTTTTRQTESPISDISKTSTLLDDEAYTVFTTGEKRLIVFLVSLAGVFSAFTAFVYFPSLIEIGKSLNVSTELMNVTVTAYLVVQGIVPSILAEISDYQGRRPVYLGAFAIYCGASLGLAFQKNYAALLVLRMVQSAGASGTVALAYGVIGDIAPPHTRAGYVGMAHIGWYAAPTLGPVLGGIIANYLGWRWVFHFLAIISGVVLILFVLFFPETSRKVVGNGSRVAQGVNQSFVSYIRQYRSAKARPTSIAVLSPFSRSLRHPQHRHALRFPNPLSCLKLVFHKATFLLLLSNAIFYLQYSCTQASLAPLLQSHYGLTPLQSGLCYLTYGIPGSLASFVVGKISNHDYTVTARNHNITIDKTKGDKIIDFPIEQARLRSVWYYILLSSSATVVYGWSVQMRWHLAIVLVTQVLTGISVTGIFTICNTLMVDWYADDPNTSSMQASAAVSLTRCLLAAGGVAVMDILFQKIDIGWTFSIIGGLCYATILLLGIVNWKGWTWRKNKAGLKSYVSDSK